VALGLQLPDGATTFKCHVVRLGRWAGSLGKRFGNGTLGEFRCGLSLCEGRWTPGMILEVTKIGIRGTKCAVEDCTFVFVT